MFIFHEVDTPENALNFDNFAKIAHYSGQSLMLKFETRRSDLIVIPGRIKIKELLCGETHKIIGGHEWATLSFFDKIRVFSDGA